MEIVGGCKYCGMVNYSEKKKLEVYEGICGSDLCRMNYALDTVKTSDEIGFNSDLENIVVM